MTRVEEVGGTTDVGSGKWGAALDARDRSRLAAYLDEVAATPVLRAIVRQSLEALALTDGSRVLEVGCGTGVFLPALAGVTGPSGRVVGLDHAPDFVAAARARVADLGLADCVEVMEGDALALPLADAAFDAAHCERVLMHLDDPVAALREMRRVVRPGGTVVAAEPDWAGIRIDHADREALDLLYGRWLRRLRQPAMGLELRRRMTEAGLVDVEVGWVTAGVMDEGVLAGYGLDLREPAAALVAEGRLDRARGEAAIAWLGEASRHGAYFATVGVMVARGTVPRG
ncbi:MAG TPA: methyltransferase domain-containing protein [Thermomicrobiales bacterium]